jgi:CRISPR-associated protein Cas2
MLYVISYDVTDGDRRRRLFESLKDFGVAVQLSVFECELDDAGLAEMLARIDFDVDREQDSLRIYRLCGGCAGDVRTLGRGVTLDRAGFRII